MTKLKKRNWRLFALLSTAAVFAYVLFIVPLTNGVPAENPAERTDAAMRAGNGDGPEQDQADRGEYLVGAANCMRCHDFGLAETAAGAGFTSFDAAVRGGVKTRGGKLDYNRMPYVEFSRISDQDIMDIYSYLWSSAPEGPVSWATVVYEFFQLERAPSASRFDHDATRGDSWNRGKYLVSNVAACGFCHGDGSTSVLLGGKMKNGWEAYNITPDLVEGIGIWSAADLHDFLRYGANYYGSSSGPMAQVVDGGLSGLTGRDTAAIYEYLRTVPPYGRGVEHARYVKNRPQGAKSAQQAPGLEVKQAAAGESDGRQSYGRHCASCHGVDGGGSGDRRLGGAPALYGNSTVASASTHNLRLVLEQGIERQRGSQTVIMPSFEQTLGTEEKESLVSYLTEQFGNRKISVTTAKK